MPAQVSQESPSSTKVVGKHPEVRVAILLFLFLNFVYLLTSTGRIRTMDEIDPVMQSESLLLRHSTALPQALSSGVYFGKLDVHGVPRSAWPVGHSILVLPWSALGNYGLAHMAGIPKSMSDLAVQTAICWSNATYAAWAVAAAFLLFMTFGIGRRAALGCSLLVAFATPLFVYSGWLYTEPVTAAILITAALLLFGEAAPSAVRIAAGALLLGFAIHMRPANIVMMGVFVMAAAVMEHGRAHVGFRYRISTTLAVVAVVSGALYLARNNALFGSPLDFGVPATAEGGKDLDSWHNPISVGLFGFLLSPGKSAFLFCPMIVLGMAGLPRLWRKNRGLAVLCGGAPLVNLLFYSHRTQWEAGYCWGPRYLVPSLILLTLPVAALFDDPPRWLRPAVWVSAILGVVVQVIGLSTNILEDMVKHRYFVGNWDYRMSYSPITGQLHLIWKYLHVEPTALGLGWDRWFIFLRMAGADPHLLTGMVAVMAAGTLVFGGLLWRAAKGTE